MKKITKRIVSGGMAALTIAGSIQLSAFGAEGSVGTQINTPLLITEVVADTDNAGGMDAYEFFEIYNSSSSRLSMDDFALRYNVSDRWNLDQSGIELAPGETLVVWVINEGNTDKTVDDFNSYYGTTLVLGQNMATVHSGGFHNSKSRQLGIQTKTGQEITTIQYNDDDVKKVLKDKGITFAYNDAATMETRLGYDTAATPGVVENTQKPEKVYTFVGNAGITPTVSANAAQNYNESWTVTAQIPESSGMILDAKLYVKGNGESAYRAFDMNYKDGALAGEVTYADAQAFSEFEWYVELNDGLNTLTSKTRKTIVVSGTLDRSTIPALTITEMLPDSSNVNSADAYEFFEVYNNSDQTINLADYKIYYNYPDNGDDSDVEWVSFQNEQKLESGQCAVFWIKNGKNDALTAEDFNSFFGTTLTEGENLFEITNGGMANSGARALRITSNVHDQVDFTAYNMDKADNTNKDQSITFRYDTASSQSVMTSDHADPTPGTVPEEERPIQAQLTVPAQAPAILNQTGATFDNGAGLTFAATATADQTSVKTVKLAYRDNTMDEYEIYSLQRGEGDTFSKTLEAVDLLNKKYYEYYFVVSDGFTSTTTEVQKIRSSTMSEEAVRFNLADGEWLTGQQNVIATGSSLKLDGADITAATAPSIESGAKIVFDASQTDVFFKNAVAVGEHVLGIFNEGTYENWRTYSYDVDSVYFTKGKDIQIDFHAGNKANALEHNEENNDDFTLRNIRLVLPDGRTLRPAGYENPDQTILMGDSSGKIEILNAVFTPADSSYTGLSYMLDTTKLTDGTHELIAADGTETKKIQIQVDNTSPVIQTNMEEGKEYKGTHQITAQVTDAGSGVASTTVKLDGKEISLPYEFSSAQLQDGNHTLEITSTDSCNNRSVHTVSFATPKENADASVDESQNGATVQNPPVLSVTVQDPTKDNMNVAFKLGESYKLGDAQIKASSGVSSTAGTNDNTYSADSANGFPYEQFEVSVSEAVDVKDEIAVDWTGTSNQEKTKMYVYNYDSDQWDVVGTEMVQDGETLHLTGTVTLASHLKDQKVQVMVQSGEGYTPEQYAAGTPASATTNTNITTSNAADTDRNQYDFTFAIESDTQYYNEETLDNPEAIGKYQYQIDIHDWVLANRSRMNIQYLFHDGDIIDDEPIESEWQNADNAYKLLDQAGLPYGVLAGNHDVGHLSGDYSYFSKYFGEKRYASNPWYGGSYKDNRAHYDLISVDGIDFLMMYVGWGIGDEEIQWMNEVLAQYPERVAILNFHEYLLASGGLGEEPQRVFDEVVSKNANVRLVFSGHYHNAQTVVNEFDDNGDGVNDRKVYQMLFDYQGLTDGGMGYMRLLHFSLANQSMTVRTYSPSLDDYDAKDYAGIGGEGIVGDETMTISFADLGIKPETKKLSTGSLNVNVCRDELIGTVENVQSGSTVKYTWNDAPVGMVGWYAEITDEFGGKTRTEVQYLNVEQKAEKPDAEPENPSTDEGKPETGGTPTDGGDSLSAGSGQNTDKAPDTGDAPYRVWGWASLMAAALGVFGLSAKKKDRRLLKK